MTLKLKDSRGKPIEKGFYHYELGRKTYFCYASKRDEGIDLIFPNGCADYLTRQRQASRLTKLNRVNTEAEMDALNIRRTTLESLFEKITGYRPFYVTCGLKNRVEMLSKQKLGDKK